jgi:hypothetical protein
LASFCVAQEATPSPSPKPKAPRVTKEMLMKELSDMETALWNAWKNKDAGPFNTHLTDDSVVVGDMGVAGKSDLAKEIGACDIKSFTLSDWKMTKFSATNVLLTYKAVTQGTCGGAPVPSTWASSLWVKRKNVWQAAFHQESAIK